MRPKIAFLTVLTINVVGFGGYWLIKALSWQANWVLHTFPGNHACKDDVPLSIIVILVEIMAGVISVAASYLIKFLIVDLYKKIDNLFPEKKT